MKIIIGIVVGVILTIIVGALLLGYLFDDYYNP